MQSTPAVRQGGITAAGKALLLIAIGSGLYGQSDRWPQFRGVAGQGIAEVPAAIEFGPKRNLLWVTEVPSGHSSPVVWGDRIFLTSYDPDSKALEALALNRKTGGILWRQTIPATAVERVHAISSPATATPIVDGERVYVYLGSAGVFCFDMEGKPVWSKPMPTANVSYGSGTSPLLAGELLILARDDGDRHMLALDRKTGEVRWDAPLGGTPNRFPGHSTPALWNDQIILHRSTEIVGYSLADGSRKWWVRITSQGTGTPVIQGDQLVVGAWDVDEDLRDPLPAWDEMLTKYDKDGDGAISRSEFPRDLAAARRIDVGSTPGAVVSLAGSYGLIDADQDGKISKAEWEAAPQRLATAAATLPRGLLSIRLGGENDMTAKSVAWSERRAVPEVPTPLIFRGRVYAVTNGGIITVVDQSSGKLIFQGRLGAGGMYYSSPVAAGGLVYFASTEGVVTVLRPGNSLDVVARNDLGEPIFATPAIVAGMVCIRTSKHLYAFGG
jgi:outer membrane protein assembly factor BamB